MKIKNPRLILLNKLHNYHLFFWFNLLPQWRPDRCVPSADKLTWFKVSAAAALQTLLQVNTEYRARQLVPPPSSRNHFNLVVCAMWIRLLSDQLVLLTWENFLQVWTSWAMVRVVHDFIKLVKTKFWEILRHLTQILQVSCDWFWTTLNLRCSIHQVLKLFARQP